MNNWEQVYARPGGTVAGFATAVGRDGAAHVFAVTMAGVYRSSDGGWSWSATSVHRGVPFCEVIAAAPDSGLNPRLYIGGRNGLYRSDTGGDTWVLALAGGHVLSVALTGGLLLIGTEQDGILRSEDGGQHFVGANAGLLDLTVQALALSPDFEHDGTGFAATPSGLYRTRNAGKSWRAMELDLPVQCLWLSPTFAEDHVVLAGTESEGIFRSQDAGVHWEPVPGLDGRSITALSVSTSQRVAAATDAGIAISDDGGRSWQTTAVALGSILSVAFIPTTGGEVLLAGLHRDGVARAAEPFESWTLSNTGLQARLLLSLTVSPAFEVDATVFAAGPDDGVIVSNDAGRAWTVHLVEPDAPPVLSVKLSPHFALDRSVFAATQAGVLRSRDGGRNWEPLHIEGEDRIVVTAPYAASGASSLLVATADGRLLHSGDCGESWHALGAPFEAEIVSLTCAPHGTVLVGTRTANQLTLWRSKDNGLQWERWLIEPDTGLLSVAVSPGYSIDETVYVGIGSRVLTPMRNTREVRSGEARPIWRYVELGASITALATPPDVEHGRTVFVATGDGVYVSRDGGERFSRWGYENGPESIVAIAISPSYVRDRLVFALEVGGALWCCRDGV